MKRPLRLPGAGRTAHLQFRASDRGRAGGAAAGVRATQAERVRALLLDAGALQTMRGRSDQLQPGAPWRDRADHYAVKEFIRPLIVRNAKPGRSPAYRPSGRTLKPNYGASNSGLVCSRSPSLNAPTAAFSELREQRIEARLGQIALGDIDLLLGIEHVDADAYADFVAQFVGLQCTWY